MQESLLDPIKLVPEVSMYPFDTALAEESYVLCIGTKRFEISEGIYQIIKLIDGKRTLSEIASEYSAVRNKIYSTKDVYAIIHSFLVPYGILKNTKSDENAQTSNLYFYFQYPIIRTNTVQVVSNVFKILYHPKILIFFILFSFVFLLHFCFFVFPVIDFNIYDISFQDTILTLMIFGILGIFHELGHSSACAHYGASPGEIGIGLYLRFLVLYSDVTDAWRLPRMQRALVDFGGIYFQLILIPILFILYLTTSSGIFLYAILFNYGSALFNLNPIFRFDGYWLFSDMAGVPNLRKRSLEILKYFAKRFILRQEEIAEPVFLRISRKIKSFLFLYGIVSTSFFILFFYKIFFLLPDLITNYPGLAHQTFRDIISSFVAGDWQNIGSTLSRFFLPSLLILMFGFAIYRMAKRLTKIVERLTKKTLRHGRAQRIH